MKNKNELYYIIARNALRKLLASGQLTPEEYRTAEGYIAEKYQPLLRSA